MSPLLAAFVGGVLGGIASGLIISLSLALFGRRVAKDLIHQEVSNLEVRFKETILDVTLGRIASFLDQSERIGQIAKRVVEILQLLLRRGPVESRAAFDAVGLAQQGLRDISAFAPKPAAAP